MLVPEVSSCSPPNRGAQLKSQIAGSCRGCPQFDRSWKEIAQCDASFRLCYNCLTPGHSSKSCRSTKTCRTCGSHHHSSLCFKAYSNSSDATNQNTSSSNSNVSQGKTNQSSSSTSSANQRNFKAQAQTHPNKHVVTPNKSNSSQASNQSPTIDTTYVTSVFFLLTFQIMYCQLQRLK